MGPAWIASVVVIGNGLAVTVEVDFHIASVCGRRVEETYPPVLDNCLIRETRPDGQRPVSKL